MTKSAKVIPLRETDTEDVIALGFERANAGRYLFNATRKCWLYWNAKTFVLDDTGLVFDAIRKHCRAHGSPKFQKAAAIHGVDTLCRSSRTFARVQNDFDADPWLLGTPDGTVDLRTGVLRAANSADMITRSTTVAPAQGLPHRFLKFLDEATGSDAGMIRFLQQVFGYGLTGSTREHAVFFIYGDGGTGKSTLLNTITRIAGTYAKNAPMATFASAAFDAHPTEIASLAGARIVAANETEQGRKWDAAKIKVLSGGDDVTARFMRQDFFTFRPEFKLLFVGNFAPSFETVDDAMRRRFYVIPFDQKPANKDELLIEALAREAPQILQWMIAGCRDWQENGLVVSEKVRAATDSYFSDQDIFSHWLDECVDRSDYKTSTPKSRGLASWNAYRVKAGERPENAKEITQRLRRVGFREGRSPDKSHRERVWLTMDLRHDE